MRDKEGHFLMMKGGHTYPKFIGFHHILKLNKADAGKTQRRNRQTQKSLSGTLGR